MEKVINGSKLQLALADYLATNAYINDTAQDVLGMVAKWIDEAPEVNAWIPVTERLPKNEKDVLVRAERKLYGIGKRGNRTVSVISMAFHTDGKMNTEQSAYTWETEYLNDEYDEEADAYIIPEGWWESVTYSECFSAICDVVTHWMPLPELPKEVE